jgi:hypothetical protein
MLRVSEKKVQGKKERKKEQEDKGNYTTISEFVFFHLLLLQY